MRNSLIVGVNDLATMRPDLAIEWNQKENGKYTPSDFTCGSGKSFSWKCSKCGNEWKEKIYRRVQGKGYCKKCLELENHGAKRSKRIKISPRNTLKIRYPISLAQWDYEKNGGSTPEDYSYGSDAMVSWVCPICGYKWDAWISSRIKGKFKCPECAKKERAKIKRCDVVSDIIGSIKEKAKRKLVTGYNDIATCYPFLMDEWDFEANKGFDPTTLTHGCNHSVQWICRFCGKTFPQKICERTRGAGCPFCAEGLRTSFQEQAVYHYIKMLHMDAVNRDKSTGKEADVLIPSSGDVIEVNGKKWHDPLRDKDEAKRKHFIDLGYKFYTLNEVTKKEERKIVGNNVYCSFKDKKSLTIGIKSLLNLIEPGNTIDVDVIRDFVSIREKVVPSKVKDPVSNYPEVAAQWATDLNGGMTPDRVSSWSNDNYYWRCHKDGYVWAARPEHRCHYGYGCAACAGKVVIVGYNDLATTHPHIAAEWDYEKNEGRTPQNVTFGCKDEVVWKDAQGHNWRSAISSRCRGAKYKKGHSHDVV